MECNLQMCQNPCEEADNCDKPKKPTYTLKGPVRPVHDQVNGGNADSFFLFALPSDQRLAEQVAKHAVHIPLHPH